LNLFLLSFFSDGDCQEAQRHHSPSFALSFGRGMFLNKTQMIQDCLLIPDFLLLFQHQQQVATAVERAKQVTMTELNAIIGVKYPQTITTKFYDIYFNE
jgi:hypothetical protein